MSTTKTTKISKSGMKYDIVTKGPSGIKPMKPDKKKYPATMRNNTVYHTRCGGQVMIDASIYGLVDMGFGFKGSRFQVDRVYSKKPIGYRGQCLKCRKEGAFIFKK